MKTSRTEDCRQRTVPLTDHCYEGRHEMVEKLAYQYWEQRGRPFGSPEMDWYAAERDLRSYLLATGVKLAPEGDLYH